MSELEFTGEYFVPGKTISRIEEDHLERYKFAAKFAKGKNILDIASGTGYGSKMLLDAGAKTVLGVDIDKKLVNYSTETYKSKSINFKLGDIVYLQEYNKETNTFKKYQLKVRITNILENFEGIELGYCMFSFDVEERITDELTDILGMTIIEPEDIK